MITLVFLSPYKYAGPASFTAHLFYAIQSTGEKLRLLKNSSKGESHLRDFGYGLRYQNCSISTIRKLPGPKLITDCSDENVGYLSQVLDEDTWLVIHDPVQLQRPGMVVPDKTIVIREPMLREIPSATFLPHPYKCAGERAFASKNAVCLSRIAKYKSIPMILEANRLLPKEKRVELRGWPDRFYVYRNLKPKFPELSLDSLSKFPLELGYAVRLASNYKFLVDMTIFPPNGGGGTQYTLLEGLDAGCTLVLHREFVKDSDVFQHEKNCYAVSGVEDLVEILDSAPSLPVDEELLSYHDYRRVGKLWKETLC